MAGATAGSATTYFNQVSDSLRVLTLTINNRCNLSCPHCYLQYDGDQTCISEDLISTVLASQFAHLAIVGKEPLVDAQSVGISERLIFDCVRSGRTVSFITNGMGLVRLQPEALASTEWIDVSLDAGPETYHKYRKANYQKVVEQANRALSSGLKTLNALHTLSSTNLKCVEDMVAVSKDVPWSKIIFSPFVHARNHGRTLVSPVSLNDLFSTLSNSSAFMECEKAILLLGEDAFREQGLNANQILNEASKAGLSSKLTLLSHDPLELGYLRLTYDGRIMTPYQSLHPADYHLAGIPANTFSNLQDAFTSLSPAPSLS